MFDEWRINFSDKGNFWNSRCEKEIIDFGIDGLDIDDNKRAILSKYVNDECSTEDFKKIRDLVLTNKLKIERSKLSKAKVKQRTKEAVMRYSLLYFLLKHGTKNLFLHEKLIIGIVRMLVDCKSTSGLFKTVFDDNEYDNSFGNRSGRLICDVTKENQENNNLEINYTNIFKISLVKFLLKNEYGEWEVKTSPGRIKTGFYSNSVEARIDETDNPDIGWINILDNTLADLEIDYFDAKVPWEDYLSQSYILYTVKNYRLAFFHSIIALESFVEFGLHKLKEILKKNIIKWIKENPDKTDDLISYFISSENNTPKLENDKIKEIVKNYKVINNDQRDLINEKFRDLININKYLATDNFKGNLIQNNSYLTYVKNELNKMIKIRNILAHGDNIDSTTDFQLFYQRILSIFLLLILEFKGEENFDFLNSFEDNSVSWTL